MTIRLCSKLVFGSFVTLVATIITAAIAWQVMPRSSDDPPVGVCIEPPGEAAPVASVPQAPTPPLSPPPPSPKVLLSTTGSGSLQRALADDGLDVTLRSPSSLPSSATELAAYDLVLLSDVPAHLITDEQASALDGYVSGGGTMLMAGGADSFGSGGYQATRMERMLPVRFDSGSNRRSDIAVVVVIDTSSSMQDARIDAARESARALAQVLSPSDFVSLVGFDSTARIVVRPQRAAHRNRISDEVVGLVTADTDDANLYAGLREAYEILEAIHATQKHVIVLSAGSPSTDGIVDLVQDMRAGGITTSAIGLAGGDRVPLNTVAEVGNGRLYMVDDIGALPKIFMKESREAQRQIDDDLVHVRVAKPVDLIAGTGVAKAPPLHGYVTTRPKPKAETILISENGEPILARWCYGSGTAIAWTSDIDHDWSTEWIRWNGYSTFWSQVVRSSLRERKLCAQ